MEIKEFEQLKKEFEQQKTKKIQLETQKASIEKSWKDEYGTADAIEIEKILEEKKEEQKNLEQKRTKLITSLQEILA